AKELGNPVALTDGFSAAFVGAAAIAAAGAVIAWLTLRTSPAPAPATPDEAPSDLGRDNSRTAEAR
ncbi:hypothetical protein ACWGCP_40575, partial [Streptomyces niveus]